LVQGAQTRPQILQAVQDIMAALQTPDPATEALVNKALRRLILRKIVVEKGDRLSVPDTKKPLLHFYAAGVRQRQETLGKVRASEDVSQVKQDDDGNRNADQPSGDAFHGNLVQKDAGLSGPVAE
jgi:hypothetical protein